MKASNSSSSSSCFVVADPEQARLLTNPETVRYFKPFVADTKSLSQAAAELDCHLNTLYYRVQTFLKTGLLKISREQKRKGRAIKYYRSIEDELYIPFNLTPYANIEEGLAEQLGPLWQQILSGLAKTYQQKGIYGRKIYREEHGGVFTNQTSNPGKSDGFEAMLNRDFFFSDVVLNLSNQEAKDLQKQLVELFSHTYEQAENLQQTATRQAYTFQIALVPY